MERFLLIMWILAGLMPIATMASPSALTYQGRIVKSDGTALEYSSVAFIFQITNPSGSCVIYQEQVTGYNMANSKGVFDVPIGTGTVSWPSAGGFSVLEAFNNDKTFSCGSCSGYSCSAGSSSYVASAGDERKLRVQFYDGIGWKLISPDSLIRSVPFAGYSLSARKLGDHESTSFVLKNEINSNVSCDSGSEFLTWDATTKTFGCSGVSGSNGGTVTEVTVASPLSVTNGQSTPHLTLAVASGSQSGYLSSSDWVVFNNKLSASSSFAGDVSGTSSALSVDKLKGTALSVAALSSGQYLKYNGTGWINSSISQSDVTGLSTALSGMVMQSQFPASCAANQTLTFLSPSGSFSCSNIAISGSQVSGNIGGNAAGFTGALGGDVTGGQSSAVVARIQGSAVSSAAPLINQVLKYDGTQWAPMALSSSDLPSGTLSGSGTAGYVPYYSSANGLANSVMYQTGSNVGLGTLNPKKSFHVQASQSGSANSVGIAIENIDGVSRKAEIQFLRPDTSAALWGLGTDISGNGGDNFFIWGGSAGGTRFFIDNQGFTGIGTSAPEVNLHLKSSRAPAPIPLGSESSIVLESTPSSAGSQGYIGSLWFGSREVSNTEGAARLSGIAGLVDADVTTTSGPSHLLFYTTPVNSLVPEERIRIQPNGNVGIGTSTPSTKLEVAGTIKATAFEGPLTATTSSSGAGSNTNPSMTFSGDTDTGFYNTTSNNQISVAAGGVNIFNFSSLGLVSSATGGASVSSANGTASAPTFSFAGDTNTGWYRPAEDTMAAATGGVERVRIGPNGNVGLGTTTPSKILDLYHANASEIVLSNNGVGNYGNYLKLMTSRPDLTKDTSSTTYGSGNKSWAIGGMNDAHSSMPGALIFMRNDDVTQTVKMTLANDGNVGIGTTTPQNTLHVSGTVDNGYVSIAAQNLSSAVTAISSVGTSSDGNSLVMESYSNAYTGNWGSSVPKADSAVIRTTVGSPAANFLLGTGTAQPLHLMTAANPRLTVDANGRVLIGSQTAYQTDSAITPWMQVNGNTATAASISLTSWLNGASNPGSLVLSHSKSTTVGTNAAVSSGDALGGVFFNGDDGAGFFRAAFIQAHVDGAPGTGSIPGRINFATTAVGGTSPVVRMSIVAGGNVGVGTASPGYKLDVQGGDINASGSVRSAGIALTSDMRFKRNIEPLHNALDKLLKIRGVSYRWRTEDFPQKQFNDRHQVGVIAQEVEAQFPEVVDTGSDGYKSVNYPALVAPLIEAVKTLYSRLIGLEDVHSEQTRRLASMDDKIQKLEFENARLKEENAATKARMEKIEEMLKAK